MRNLLLLAFVNLLWAIQFPASRVAAQELHPLTLTWFAMLLAALLMAPVACWERSRRPPTPAGAWPARIGQVLTLGLTGALVAQMCLNWGLERAPASNAAVINLTIPVLMAILASLLLGERMSPLRWAAFALSIPGVLLASGIQWNETSFADTRYLTGNLLVFVSCWGSAFYNVYSKRALVWLGPAQLLVATFAISLVTIGPAMLIYEPAPLPRLLHASAGALLGLAAIGALSLALSMFLFFHVLGEVEATQASLSIYFLPIFGVILSALTLHEKMSATLFAGGALVGLGAWLVSRFEAPPKETVPQP